MGVNLCPSRPVELCGVPPRPLPPFRRFKFWGVPSSTRSVDGHNSDFFVLVAVFEIAFKEMGNVLHQKEITITIIFFVLELQNVILI
jgi:hypothetical protein